jgi:hypothetical protein
MKHERDLHLDEESGVCSEGSKTHGNEGGKLFGATRGAMEEVLTIQKVH